MASSNIKPEDNEYEQLQTASGIRDPHQWSDSSDDENLDTNEFFDAHDTEFQPPNQSTSKEQNSDAELLHERLNSQLSTDEKPQKKSPEDPYFIDEEVLAERDALLTDEEKKEHHEQSVKAKDEGNDLFGRAEYDQALEKYSSALSLCPMKYTRDLAIIYANRAACLMKMEKYEAAIQSSTASIKHDPTYIKALLRRAESYKAIDKLEDALQDYQKIVELDPSNAYARKEVYILPDQIKERNEKLKAEMFGKLKELGNMVLKPFGLSTENFKLQQDPSTGSYSVNFQK